MKAFFKEKKRSAGYEMCIRDRLSGIESRTSSPVRIVRDQELTANMAGIYPVSYTHLKGFLMQHKFPFVSLHIQMEGNDLDVNVHPSKMDQRFRSGRH